MCNQQVRDYAYVTVEDERNNLFEVRRNFATIAEQQGFVNVISSEYMLREYMAENTQLFTADAKAIPYITADFARTVRNTVLRLCLKLCIDGLTEEELRRELMLIGLDITAPDKTLWDEICSLFCSAQEERYDRNGGRLLLVETSGPGGRLELDQASTLLFSRRYSVELGRFESIYTIENRNFASYLLEDLQNATYVAEQDGVDRFIGTELRGHIYQKYLPGQFFTLNGKYYEMVSVAIGNRILVRRASEHINGRFAYRQTRNYFMARISNSSAMGELKTVNGIDIYYQFADFSVDTPSYWKLNAYNDFGSGSLVEINGVPTRRYFNKQILRLDFSRLGDAFTDSVRITLTALLNEAFVTLFADNQFFISAVTPGTHPVPLTYSMCCADTVPPASKSIFIIEDSQLDLGLLIAVERNMHRILQIISDYLAWNEEKIEESQRPPAPEAPKEEFSPYAGPDEESKKISLIARFFRWVRSLFTRKRLRPAEEDAEESAAPGSNGSGTTVVGIRCEESQAGGDAQATGAAGEMDNPKAEYTVDDREKTAVAGTAEEVEVSDDEK